MATHHLDDTQPHPFWDNSLPPRVRIQPGDSVVFETLEASAGQIFPGCSSEAAGALDFSLKHKGWGWNAVIPGFGLLGVDFAEPYVHHYKLGEITCEFRPDIQIPYEPFCGVMGVGPREAGRFTTIPPRENAGNIDIRHLFPGTKVFFPVLVPGALFSCGDCHSAQGDGEVNGTGIETMMSVTLTFNLQKRANIPELRFITPPGKKLTVADEDGYFVVTAHGPDLFKDSQQAIRYMIDYLSSQYKMTREQAYCLCGAAVDLKISEIVDGPNWIVSAYLHLSILSRASE